MIPRLARVGLFVLLASGCDWLGPGYNGTPIDPPIAMPAVVWQRADGSEFNLPRETDGHVTVLLFGYTHCPDICPLELTNLSRALHQLGADTAAAIRVLFVTLDPERDEPAGLANWVHGFDGRFVPLRGPIASVDAAVARLGLDRAAPVDSVKKGADPAHASAAVVFAPDGTARLLMPATLNAEAWAHDLRKLLAATSPRR